MQPEDQKNNQQTQGPEKSESVLPTHEIVQPEFQAQRSSQSTESVNPITSNVIVSSQNEPIDNKHKALYLRSTFLIIICIVAIAIVVASVLVLSRHNKTNQNVVISKNNVSGTAPSSQNIGSIKVTYITIPTNINETNRRPQYDSSGKFYDSFTADENPNQAYIESMNIGGAYPIAPKVVDDIASTASGNYVYIDASTAKTNNDGADSVLLGGKLIYDGKTIYQGSDLVPYSEAISQNGLHYAFIRDDTAGLSIYIDNKLSSYKLNYPIPFMPIIGVSNDGTKIAYDGTDSVQNDAIYVNQTKVDTIYNLSNIAFSSELSQSIVAGGYPEVTNPGDPFYDLLVNGKSIQATDSNTIPGNLLSISDNGEHYAYTIATNASSTATEPNLLYVDTNKIGSISDPVDLNINDNGQYSYVDLTNADLYINNKSYQLSSKYINEVNSNNILSAINSSGNNYLVANPIQKYYLLNGKTISLNGDIFNVQFVDNTLYVYRFSN